MAVSRDLKPPYAEIWGEKQRDISSSGKMWQGREERKEDGGGPHGCTGGSIDVAGFFRKA